MCGICGKISLNSTVDEALIRKMCSVLEHRGPDSEGAMVCPPRRSPAATCEEDMRLRPPTGFNVGLGHRRLAIIDLSPAGHQPMSNEDGSVWIVIKIFIFSMPAVRPGLMQAGI